MNVQPRAITDAVPVNIVPPQQNRYSPVVVLNSTTMLGFESSCKHPLKTDTVKLQVAVLPDASVAVQVTVVVPTGKVVPLGGVQITVTPGQLSEAVGDANVTVVLVVGGHVAAAAVVTFEGQVIDGGCVSLTVTVNVQPGPAVEQVMVVVPTGKNEPLAGEQVIVPHSPVLLGAG